MTFLNVGHRLLANQGLHLEFLLPPTPTLSRSPQGAAVVAVVLLACLPLLADMSPHLPTWFRSVLASRNFDPNLRGMIMVLTYASYPSHPLQWCLHRRTQLNLLERRSTGSWKRDLRRRGGAAPPAEGEVRRDNLIAKSFMRHVAFNLIKLLLVVEDYPQYITSRSKKKHIRLTFIQANFLHCN